jgi:hypothetical protein
MGCVVNMGGVQGYGVGNMGEGSTGLWCGKYGGGEYRVMVWETVGKGPHEIHPCRWNGGGGGGDNNNS